MAAAANDGDGDGGGVCGGGGDHNLEPALYVIRTLLEGTAAHGPHRRRHAGAEDGDAEFERTLTDILKHLGERGLEGVVEAIPRLKTFADKHREKIEAFFQAASTGHIRGLRTAVGSGVLVDARCWDGRTALQVASRYGQIDAVRLLLSLGADVNARNARDESTALYSAAVNARERVALALLEHGADPNAAAEQDAGQTALHVAAMWGRTELVRALLRFGADTAVRDACGRAAEDWARAHAHHDVVEIIADYDQQEILRHIGRLFAED